MEVRSERLDRDQAAIHEDRVFLGSNDGNILDWSARPAAKCGNTRLETGRYRIPWLRGKSSFTEAGMPACMQSTLTQVKENGCFGQVAMRERLLFMPGWYIAEVETETCTPSPGYRQRNLEI